MKFHLHFLVLLLYDTVIANVCNSVYRHPSWISFGLPVPSSVGPSHPAGAANSASTSVAPSQCSYFIEAPTEHVVTLNFTHIDGLYLEGSGGTLQPYASAPVAGEGGCLPQLVVVEVMPSGRERIMDTICVRQWGWRAGGGEEQDKEEEPSDTVPTVFQSNSHKVKVTYRWRPGERQLHSGKVNCTFSFQLAHAGCAFLCGDDTCLPYSNLVCNESPDCANGADEHGCYNTVPQHDNKATAPAQVNQSDEAEAMSANNALIATVLVICGAVLLIVLFTVYWVFCRDPSSGASSSAGLLREQLHRHPTSSSSNEVVYVPPAPSDPGEREAQRVRERQLLLRSANRSVALNLPPAIPKSRDGEEGYVESQLSLHRSGAVAASEQQGVVVPPNRTVYDSQPLGCASDGSPPSYRECSHQCHSSSSGGGGRPCYIVPPPPSHHHNTQHKGPSPPPYTPNPHPHQQHGSSSKYPVSSRCSGGQRSLYTGGGAPRTASLTSTGHSRTSSSTSTASSYNTRTPSGGGGVGPPNMLLGSPQPASPDFSGLPTHLDSLFSSGSSGGCGGISEGVRTEVVVTTCATGAVSSTIDTTMSNSNV